MTNIVFTICWKYAGYTVCMQYSWKEYRYSKQKEKKKKI